MIEAQTADDGAKKKDLRSRPRPLYDIPYMFEAREFLRKKLIGKKVRTENNRYLSNRWLILFVMILLQVHH